MKSIFSIQQIFHLGLFLIGFPLGIQAQVVIFNYDGSGNRICRQQHTPNVITPKKNVPPVKEFFDSPFSADLIKIGPNPTSGILNIEITRFDERQNITVHIYNASAQLIAKKGIENSITEFNLTNKPNGVYIVSIISNDNFLNYKIIKK